MKKKKDANQDEIVKALRDAGATVAITSAVHKGFPDLVVGFKGRTYLLEVKDGRKIPSAQKLTPDQVRFFAEWEGHAAVVNSVEAALAAIGLGLLGEQGLPGERPDQERSGRLCA